MRKLKFVPATAVLTILFVLALVRVNLERFIPQLPPNRLANHPGAFLAQAVHQPVDWEPSVPLAFAKAATLRRPVLFVVGSPLSRASQLTDSRVFSNWSVAALINNSFVPVRIDLNDEPEWESAIFPISRLKLPYLPGFRVFVLTSTGKLVNVFQPLADISEIDPTPWQDLLVLAKTDADSQPPSRLPAYLLQESDRQELAGSPKAQLPAFRRFSVALYQNRSVASGAFVQSGYRRMLPGAWLYQGSTDTGSPQASSLASFLERPFVDVIRGGFLDVSESREGGDVAFSQVSTANAQMARTLAELGVSRRQDFYTVLAKQTFDMMLRDLRRGGLFLVGRLSDVDVQTDRSPTCSYPISRLNSVLDAKETAWAVQNLNLNVFSNRQLVPFATDPRQLAAPEFGVIRDKLLKAVPAYKPSTEEQYLDVNGTVLASLCRCARIWNDGPRLKAIAAGCKALEGFLPDNKVSVSHTRQPAKESDSLSDYLSFADAELEYYLATGQPRHFALGKGVLLQAVRRFLDPLTNQVLSLPRDTGDPLPADMNNPDIYDSYQESTTAQAIRLCFAYGRMLSPSPQSRRLLSISVSQVAKYSDLSVSNSPALGYYYLAAANVADPLCAFVVGPRASADADRLFRLRPSRLVSPASAIVRPDLLRREPGVYLCFGSSVAGPYTVEKAAALMPVLLRVPSSSGAPKTPRLP